MESPVFGVVKEEELLLLHHGQKYFHQVLHECQHWFVGLKEFVEGEDFAGQRAVSSTAEYRAVVPEVSWLIAVERDEGVVGPVRGVEFHTQFPHFLEHPNHKPSTLKSVKPPSEVGLSRAPDPPSLVIDTGMIVPLEVGRQLVELFARHLRHLGEGPVLTLRPVGVVDPGVEARGPLVAPEGVAAVGEHVGKRTVEEFK